MSIIFQELRESYKTPLIILAIVIMLVMGLKSRMGFFESSFVFDILIFVLPLTAAVSSFIVSRRYGNSKIFGRSYFLLGLGFFCTFSGEFVYFVFYETAYKEILQITQFFFIASYSFTLSHIIINIRYFAEKIEPFQKILLVLVPVSVVIGFTYLIYENSYEFDDYFFFNLMFVSISAINLGFVIVGFTLFRHTALISAWFLLLIGFLIGTIGDIEYRYHHIFGADYLENYSSVLWITSFMVLVYALHRHKKSM